ncbi:MAG: 50S ribosomal protein L21 [Patescibacteria group bacterium]|nr:50S ribosomal protein L21 [Patescibacteria group bacterium]MCL5224453.1 50S ribosomal protein L21 [Patescibacteria group bacterium]
MFAVIETGGKQYVVTPGTKLKVEHLPVEAGKSFVFDKVLLVSGDKDGFSLGRPYVSGAKVEAEIVRNSRERKKIVFRYHSKTRYRKKKGHRQQFTEVKINKISS